MAYSNFTLPTVIKKFDLQLIDNQPLRVAFTPITPTPALTYILERGASVAVKQNTEKARSEFIIAPILLEVRGLVHDQVSVFSGVEFNVDSEQGLIGICDFLFSKSTQQLYLEAPVLIVVEAKNENFKQGIAQATAEMVATQIFNEREGKPQTRVCGAVTIGNSWQFLHLEHRVLTVDNRSYDLEELPEILGILVAMLS
jgi:hypothetical protein